MCAKEKLEIIKTKRGFAKYKNYAKVHNNFPNELTLIN